MDADKVPTAGRWQDHRAGQVPPAAACPRRTRDAGRSLGCGAVAQNRAARYARKRRIPKPLWLLIAAFILIFLIFERRAVRAFLWTDGRPTAGDDLKNAASISDDEQNLDRLPDPKDAGSAIQGMPEPRYRPPADFLARDAAQVAAFLLRNRGRLDNDAVRARWAVVDHISLPLAIYLREIEATAAWNDLEKEIAAAPPGTPAASSFDVPKSLRHRKILRLMPEWTQRGEAILSPEPANDTGSTATRDIGDDDPDRRPPKP